MRPQEEEGEEEDDEQGPVEDNTFLTGVGIQERRRRRQPGEALEEGEEGEEAPSEPAAEPTPSTAMASEPSDGAPLWESIADPTERLAVALGLDPLLLPLHTHALTADSAGAVAALRFALAHPLVEADEGLGPAPHYTASTAAAALKRRSRRPDPTARLAPLGSGAAAAAAAAGGGAGGGTGGGTGLRGAKIHTVEALLDGMKVRGPGGGAGLRRGVPLRVRASDRWAGPAPLPAVPRRASWRRWRPA